MSGKPQTIDEYLARLSDEKRAALQKLRRAIKAAAPKAEECISYQIPAFRLGGRMLVAFGAAANHCAFYPGSAPVEGHKDELKAYPRHRALCPDMAQVRRRTRRDGSERGIGCQPRVRGVRQRHTVGALVPRVRMCPRLGQRARLQEDSAVRRVRLRSTLADVRPVSREQNGLIRN